MKHDLTFSDNSAYGSTAWCAQRLGKSVAWLRTHRSRLEREGFPRVDSIVGLVQKADVDAFLARRRKVADAVHQDAHHATTSASGENLARL
jgi:hypothetical protein